jgi:ATP-dependent DNA helicase PIF1
MVLNDIDDIVSSMNKDICDYGLPKLDDQDVEQGYHNREVREQYSLDVNEVDLKGVHNLNPEQLIGFTKTIDHMINKMGRVFFVDGPGSTGKTFLYRCLIANVRSKGLIVVATTTSGIAASILPCGRTAHSVFKIPIKISDGSICKFSKQSDMADLLRRVALIIWEEVPSQRGNVLRHWIDLYRISWCHTPFRDSWNEASIRVPRMFHSHV